MAKAFGILLIVLGVWLGVEIFTNGMDGAFGGVFAELGPGASTPAGVRAEPPMQKIRSRVLESMKTGAARSTAGIDDRAEDEGDDTLDRDKVDLESVDQ